MVSPKEHHGPLKAGQDPPYALHVTPWINPPYARSLPRQRRIAGAVRIENLCALNSPSDAPAPPADDTPLDATSAIHPPAGVWVASYQTRSSGTLNWL